MRISRRGGLPRPLGENVRNATRSLAFLPLLLPVLLSGCSIWKHQFQFSDLANLVLQLSWDLFIWGATAMALVLALMMYKGVAPPGRKPALVPGRFIFVGSVIFPLAMLGALLIYDLRVGAGLSRPAPDGTLTVEIAVHQ